MKEMKRRPMKFRRVEIVIPVPRGVVRKDVNIPLPRFHLVRKDVNVPLPRFHLVRKDLNITVPMFKTSNAFLKTIFEQFGSFVLFILTATVLILWLIGTLTK